MVSLREKHTTFVLEHELLYEYTTQEEWHEHREEMKQKEGFATYFWKRLDNGHYTCRYIMRTEKSEQILP